VYPPLPSGPRRQPVGQECRALGDRTRDRSKDNKLLASLKVASSKMAPPLKVAPVNQAPLLKVAPLN